MHAGYILGLLGSSALLEIILLESDTFSYIYNLLTLDALIT